MGARELDDVAIRPQAGPQSVFLASDADIAVYGGSAFAGKTFGLLLEDLRHVHDGDFASVTFRRETTQIRNPGGLWDEATKLYAAFGARALSNSLEQYFPSGAVAKFAHLEHADSVYAWDGAQIPLLKFDQLESFEGKQFWYMLSRNRDPSGKIRPYCRATCNPDPDSFLATELIPWWLDPSTGFPIWERSGVLRWFVRVDETLFWGDSAEELIKRFGREDLPRDDPNQPRPMSVTFVPGRIWDNKIGLQRDPGYLSKLKALQRVERERLLGDTELGGNWKIRAGAGNMFSRHWCETIPAEPEAVDWVRGWDLAGTRPSPTNPDPDWTVGVKIGKYRDRNRWVISANVVRDRVGPAGVETMMKNTADVDGKKVKIRCMQDPGQAGKAQARTLTGLLAGYEVRFFPGTGDKVTRFSPFSAQAEAGNVDIVAGIPDAFLGALENFPDAAHDDDADAVSEAFARWALPAGGGNIIEFMRRQAEEIAKERAEAEGAEKGGNGNGSNGKNGKKTNGEAPVHELVKQAPPQRKRSSNYFEAMRSREDPE